MTGSVAADCAPVPETAPNPVAVLWHNPRCSTSRKTLDLLTARGLCPRLRLYLVDPPSRAEIVALLAALDRPAADLLRWKDLDPTSNLSRHADPARIIDALVTAPRLIERPVLIIGARARIGRPPEAVLDLL